MVSKISDGGYYDLIEGKSKITSSCKTIYASEVNVTVEAYSLMWFSFYPYQLALQFFP